MHAHAYEQYIFRFCNQSNFSTVRCMKIHLHANAKKKSKIVWGFQILRFYWLFSTGVIAVKGLKQQQQWKRNEKQRCLTFFPAVFASVSKCCQYNQGQVRLSHNNNSRIFWCGFWLALRGFYTYFYPPPLRPAPPLSHPPPPFSVWGIKDKSPLTYASKNRACLAQRYKGW